MKGITGSQTFPSFRILWT